MDSPLYQLQWVGKDDRYVFAVTDKKKLWRSTDGGASFTDVTSRLATAIQQKEEVEITQIFQDAAAPQNALFIGSGSFMWATNDYGETFHARQTPNMWQGNRAAVRVHPFITNWMLALVRRPNCQVRWRQGACPPERRQART